MLSRQQNPKCTTNLNPKTQDNELGRPSKGVNYAKCRTVQPHDHHLEFPVQSLT